MTGAGIPQAHRFERAEAHRIGAPAGHDLDGHTALVDLELLPLEVLELDRLGGGELGGEALIALLIEGTVDVVGIAAAIAGGKEHLFHIDAGGLNDRGGGIEEAEILGGDQPADGLRESLGGEGAGGEDHLAVRDLSDLPLDDGDQRVAADPLGDQVGKADPVHRQRPAGGDGRSLGAGDAEGAQALHLRLEQAGSGFQPLGLEGVGADELGKAGRVVGRGELLRLHLPKDHRDAVPGQGPGGLAAGKSGADDGDRGPVHSLPTSLS